MERSVEPVDLQLAPPCTWSMRCRVCMNRRLRKHDGRIEQLIDGRRKECNAHGHTVVVAGVLDGHHDAADHRDARQKQVLCNVR